MTTVPAPPPIDAHEDMLRLWHATDARNLEAILARGLEPRIGPRSAQLGEPVPAIYAFDDLAMAEDAVGEWLGDALVDAGVREVAFLRIEIDPRDWSRDLRFDGYSHMITRRIPPESISLERREPLED